MIVENPASAESATSAYLDYAAATPLDPEVLEAMTPYLTGRFYNPSAPYALARSVRADVEAARATVARCIGARPGNVTFTAGATEANNLAFAATDGHVVTDAIEHESVLACAEARSHAIVGVGPDGRVDPEDVLSAVTPATQLVSVSLANGEIGCVQPVRELARMMADLREKRLAAGDLTPLCLHVDASQAASCLTVDVGSLGCDLLTLSAAKIGGPKQVGSSGPLTMLSCARSCWAAARRAACAPGPRTSPVSSASRGRWSLSARAAARSRIAWRRSGAASSAGFSPSFPGRWSAAPRRQSSACPGFST